MNELTACYNDLLEECLPIKQRIEKKYEELISLYWEIGKILVRHEKTGSFVKHGEATIKKLAEDLRMNYTTLYRTRQFALGYPTEKDFNALRKKIVDAGRNFSWTEIRNNVLPAPKDQPESYGGKPAVVDMLMSRVETLSKETEELAALLHDSTISVEQKEQIVGVTTHALDVMSESAREPEYLPPGKTNGYYLEYIRSLSCLICSYSAPSHPHHVETGGVGMKGSDYLTVPLCWEHHREYHDTGKKTFGEKYNIDLFCRAVDILVAKLEVSDNGKFD